MSRLFLKVGRIGTPRTMAWDTARIGAIGIDRNHYRMTAAEEGEFTYLIDREKHSCLGAGGQYEYRVYDLIEMTPWPYAIVRPDVTAVREQYPDACRVVNLSTGRESALMDNVQQARDSAEAQRAKKGLGSFN